MQKLVDGIHAFQSGVFGPQRELFERLVERQAPDALFITCSDSRINPNLITQTEPGELFILRNAGNIVPPWGASSCGEVATIEYALEALQIRDIIVCGHTRCGAVQALLEPAQLETMPAVKTWLGHAEATRRVLRDNYPDATVDPAAAWEIGVEENVLVQIENMRTHPSVMARLMSGRLKLHAWVYDLAHGTVHAFDPEQGQFVPVVEAGRGEPEAVDHLRQRRVI